MLFDPWDDAAQLVQRLNQSDSKLFLVIGAEAWCYKCRELRPAFEELAQESRGNDVHLWLDMQEHAQFIDPYLPDDLPMLFIYQNGALKAQKTLALSSESLDEQIAAAVNHAVLTSDPGIYQKITDADWAD